MSTFKLRPADFKEAAHLRTHWAAAVPAGTTAEDLERPEFWSHVAQKARRMDSIDVLPEDEAYFAELLVLSSGVGFVKVKTIRFVELSESDEDVDSPVEVKWRGPARKFSVLRKADSIVLKDGFADKDDAARYALDYQRKVAA